MNQLTLFDLQQFTQSPAANPQYDPAWDYDDSQDPPDPDDYPSIREYEIAWQQWEKKYPRLVKYCVGMSPCKIVGEQVASTTSESANTNNLVKFPTKKSAPQHDNHWVEKYWVERCGNKYWYWRYMWMSGRKIHRLYIGSANSAIAKSRKAEVESAIADGQTPGEIQNLIRSWRKS